MKKVQFILFDLDGTLIDTAPDLCQALNDLLAQHGKPPVPYSHAKIQAAYGAQGLIQLGFGIDKHHKNYPTIRKQYLALYEQQLTTKTCFFPGIPEVLDYLDDKKIVWGIVTNKPTCYTQPLVEYFKLDSRTQCVISGDTLTNNKPHPEPLLYACKKANIPPESTLYIGDTENDIIAAKHANIPMWLITYGYLGSKLSTEFETISAIINEPGDIIKLLDN